MLIEYERVTGEEFMAVFNGSNPAEILKKAAAPKRKRKKAEATPAEPLNAETQSVPI